MVSQELNLHDKVALVAGDSRFWSRHVAAALVEAGADVVIAARGSEKLEKAAKALQRPGRKVITFPTVMTDSSQVEEMVGKIIAEFGRIDILVNAADIPFARPFLEVTDEEWQGLLAANLFSPFLTCRAVGKHMRARKQGRIINLTSCLAERGLANSSAYCAAAGGVLQLTRALALEWARESITVNAIGAGWFSEDEGRGANEEALLRYLPLKRYGRPQEVGSLVVYLASDAASFVTGQFMYVDGGVMQHA